MSDAGLYIVEIKATVVKQINVLASSQEEAIELAQAHFDASPIGAKRYEQDITHVEQISTIK